ncbi:MAG: T9SS type A sorting domain-containing protein [Putridiphycobacter sp.]|nr:T9SS type A sorting domain-containing protein [Putridiphycobacter sp.]
MLCFFYDDCKSFTNGLGLETKSVAIKKDEEEGKLLADASIYPNPANNFVAIELPLVSKGAKIQIFGLDGKLVFETQMQKPIYIWDTSSMPAGTYIINIELNSEKMAKKVVLVK